MKTRDELMASDAPHAWEVEVEHCDRMIYVPGYKLNEVKTHCFVGSESNARKKALMKPHAKAVLSTSPLTYRQWLSVYGEGRM